MLEAQQAGQRPSPPRLRLAVGTGASVVLLNQPRQDVQAEANPFGDFSGVQSVLLVGEAGEKFTVGSIQPAATDSTLGHTSTFAKGDYFVTAVTCTLGSTSTDAEHKCAARVRSGLSFFEKSAPRQTEKVFS